MLKHNYRLGKIDCGINEVRLYYSRCGTTKSHKSSSSFFENGIHGMLLWDDGIHWGAGWQISPDLLITIMLMY